MLGLNCVQLTASSEWVRSCSYVLFGVLCMYGGVGFVYAAASRSLKHDCIGTSCFWFPVAFSGRFTGLVFNNFAYTSLVDKKNQLNCSKTEKSFSLFWCLEMLCKYNSHSFKGINKMPSIFMPDQQFKWHDVDIFFHYSIFLSYYLIAYME